MGLDSRFPLWHQSISTPNPVIDNVVNNVASNFEVRQSHNTYVPGLKSYNTNAEGIGNIFNNRLPGHPH